LWTANVGNFWNVRHLCHTIPATGTWHHVCSEAPSNRFPTYFILVTNYAVVVTGSTPQSARPADSSLCLPSSRYISPN
jgi:hypothetical protein